ncbi:minor capsid protein [Microbispora amethystogenes]|uniref:minor capsid protein n=1 Tax=Microbispora amethystogenes TaxID=1427754 RepID=UPI0033E53E59
MTPPEGFTRQLLNGLGQLLEDNGAGDWDPDGMYGPTQTAITMNGLPSSPDMAISMAVYGLGTFGDDIEQTDSEALVQFRCRGTQDQRVADDLADAVFNAVHGLSDHTLSTGVHILLAKRKVIAPIGRDGSGRVERADSYEILCHRPSAHRP